ncbi:MAG: redox-regulated ATPase YchF [Desulfurococcales archaeon ex4484_204]|nr:MAG: redox-regulated ATPase YchF [Desulfurococcales archaeon ex4484_204]
MPPPPPLIGIVGKTNVGKSTFFEAATLINVKIENRPFVTIEPNIGIGYVRRRCAHVELGLRKCDPVNSLCIKGYRFIPVKLMDVAGLIKGAHKGRGLGNKFMDSLRQADVLLLIVDMSGSTNEEGLPVRPGTNDPVEEVRSIEFEIDEWFYGVISKDWVRLARSLDVLPPDKAVDLLARRVSGLSIKREHVVMALRDTKLEHVKFSSWSIEELKLFTKRLRSISKPIVIIANKMDIPEAQDNLRKALKELKGRTIIPVSAMYELALRRASKCGLIDYIPGDADFTIAKPQALNKRQLDALERVRDFMRRYGGTGVQQALNTAVFNVLKMIAVYPVEDPHKLTDHAGHVLPDAYLVREGVTAIELASMIHTDLAKGFLYAILAKSGKKVGASHALRDGDIVKIVSATARH